MSKDEEPEWGPWRITLLGSTPVDPRLGAKLRNDSVDGLKALGVDMSAFEEDPRDIVLFGKRLRHRGPTHSALLVILVAALLAPMLALILSLIF